MRREGYEFPGGSRPRVITHRGPNGEKLEPYEELAIDVPEEFMGVVMEELGPRKAQMIEIEESRAGIDTFALQDSCSRSVRISLRSS